MSEPAAAAASAPTEAMRAALAALRLRGLCGRGRISGQQHRRAVAQPVAAIGDHHVADGNPA
jgi:hypothetical protein